MENIFDAATVRQYIGRINALSRDAAPLWGVMNPAQVLAHMNVTYELVYEPQKHKKAGIIAKFFMKNFVKPKVVGELPYPKNSPTGPMFRVSAEQDFELEKKRLIGFLQKTQQLGETAFDGKESHSFGKLKATEWNNMFAKHLNHHLSQFGV